MCIFVIESYLFFYFVRFNFILFICIYLLWLVEILLEGMYFKIISG